MDLDKLSQEFSTFVEQFPSISYQIAATLIVILGLWLVRLIAIRLINRKIGDDKIQYKWRKNLTYVTGFLALFIIGSIWSEGFKSFSTFLGLLSAGLAIALKDPVSDLAGWMFILWRKPLEVGDRIQLGEVKGDVIDIRLFKFTVLEIGNWVQADQSTGRVVHVPNHKVFTDSLANYTSDFEFIWNEIEVLVTFESDWKKAKDILQEIADKHLKDFVEHAEQQVKRATKSYLIHYRHLTPIVYTDVKESGINLTIRHLTDPRKRRKIGQAIWEDILDRFDEHENIELAYPTMRIYR
ncbi:MAG: mechanosensitive ion channel family protein [Candidatus Halalkalibacterium sp. M3_1C_030]